MEPVAVYVHFPFCVRKCAYCDFNSRPPQPGETEHYLRALVAELSAAPPALATSIYFGGGTPTLYPPSCLGHILERVADRFHLISPACGYDRTPSSDRRDRSRPDRSWLAAARTPPTSSSASSSAAAWPVAEVTVEANPGTVTAASLRALRAAGFNRLSLGVQSFDDAELALLGRVHNGAQARRTVEDARAAGFDNLSIDLIRGLPGQSLAAWEANLHQAIALQPDHISAYGLSLEHGTPLAERVAAGALSRPLSDDPEWVSVTVDLLASAGYERYEISNYARPGHACRHNLTYWRNLPYVGIGAGAWSYHIGPDWAVRSRNHPDVARYCAAALAGDDLVAERDIQDLHGAAAEALMVGLRLSEGVDVAEVRRRFGVDVRAAHAELIRQLVASGFMLDDGVRLRLTFQGLLVQSAIAARFLPDP